VASSAPKSQKTSRPSSASATRTPVRVAVPTADDLDRARDDALLQLKIGRTAHAYSVVVSVALTIAGVLVLVLAPDVRAAGAGTAIASNFFLGFVVASAAYLAFAGLRIKWEAYQLWPWEGHFWGTVLAVVFAVALVVVYVGATFNVGVFSGWPIIPWLYPLAVLGVSAPLAAMALTWGEWSARKTSSVICALLPVGFTVVVFVPTLSLAAELNLLATSLFVSALLYQTAGSFLHLISSGTRTHQREVINSGQTRLFHLAEEVRGRDEELRSREHRLVEREARVEAAEATSRRSTEANETAQAQLAGMEQELQHLSEELNRRQEAFAQQTAETHTLARTLEDRESTLAIKLQDLARDRSDLTARERGIADREAEHRRRHLELATRETEVDRRLAAIAELESRLEARRVDIEQKTADLLRRESAVPVGEAGAGAAVRTAPTADLAQREVQLSQLKITLDEQNLTLGRRAKQLEQQRQELAQHEAALGQRELAAEAREAAMTQREADAQATLGSAEERRLRYDTAVQEYEKRLAEVDRREAELTTKGSELERIERTVRQRESTLAGQRSQLVADQSALEAARQAAITADRERASRVATGQGALAGAGLEGAAGAAAPEMLTPAAGRRVPDRQPTGTARLDDLLLGGIPPKGHLLLVGDAFVGKEIVLYSYLAEGLRRGEDAVVVTATRSPEEVAGHLREVMPEFPEFERSGRVRWIDASHPEGNAATKSGGHPGIAVAGPDDHAGILKGLVAAMPKPSEPARAVRVGFLGLSAALAHSEEKAGSVFVQNFVGILKPRAALALYTLEAGALTEAQVERLLGRMDGAIRFRQERDKTFLSVAGVGDVATRDWIECRATNRALIVGSFSLERIR